MSSNEKNGGVLVDTSAGAVGRPEFGEETAEAARVLEKLEAESRFRRYTGGWGRVVAWIAIAMSVYHLVTSSGMWLLPAMEHRSVHLAFLLGLTFLLYPAFGKREKNSAPSVFDLAWCVISLASSLYILFFFVDFSQRGTAAMQDYVMGGVLIVCVLEATRRSVGKELMLLSLVFLAYGLWGEYIPGMLGHTGFTLRRIIYQLYLSSEGIFGVALGVSSTYIYLFILFGAFLSETGMGAFIKDLSMCLTGRTIGGEAKVAVVASGLMGMINGSAVGNVAATGTFTIPLMRDAGFKPVFSAAVVAVAGTGGMIMPPVMGAASFIMAEYLGLHYGKIMLAAALPAILYYVSELAYVHIEAKKLGMRRTSGQNDSFWTVMKRQGYQIVPVVVIVYLLVIGRTPLFAAFWGIVSSVGVSFTAGVFKKQGTALVKNYVKALEGGARQSVGVGVACAVVGNIIGITNLTGLGLVLGDNIVSLAEGNIFLTALLTMVVSIILGMGLPTTACYIVTATIAAPALIRMDVNPLAAHMFVYYFACLSNLTPPVAIASYGAAGISGQNPAQVGWTGFRISLAGFIIPFTFIYSPQLLFVEGTVFSVTLAAFSAFIGVIAAAAALQDWLLAPLGLPCRVLLFTGACLLIFPGLVSDLIGFAIVLGLATLQKLQLKIQVTSD